MDLVNTHPIKKSDLGFHGNLFGGKLMAWIDASAAAYAMEVCHNRRMVTICIDKCVFKKPAKEWKPVHSTFILMKKTSFYLHI
jgi:acyl-CoA hydrolase